MDFASLMSKEISKAKGDPDKKYVRRGEEEAARVAAYNEEQERSRQEREERMARKRKMDEEEAERRREREDKKRRLAEESRQRREEEEAAKDRERRQKLGLPEVPAMRDPDETPATEEEPDMADEELIEKLRELEEPVRLFGESHLARLRRYYQLLKRSLLEPKRRLTTGPLPTTLEPVPEIEMKIASTLPKDADSRHFLYRQLASYFNMLLSEWELALSRRELSVKQSVPGRQAYTAMVQSRDNMKPLIRKFEKSELEDNILRAIIEIVTKAQQRRYVDANDAYLRLSIGKAYVPPYSVPGEYANRLVHGRLVSPWLGFTRDLHGRSCTGATIKPISSPTRSLASTCKALSGV